MKYRVLPEFLNMWTDEDVDELIVDDVEIRRLAHEWADHDVEGMLNELYEEVEEIE